MKVIFLDFDGVLNGCAEPDDPRQSTDDDFGNELWCADQINADRVERLNRIVDATGAVVVLSTSWRLVHPLRRLRAMLELKGFRGRVIGDTPTIYRTPDGEERHRYHEIQWWLDTAGAAVESFVILDDWLMGPLTDHHVHSAVQLGLEDKHVDAAVEILNR